MSNKGNKKFNAVSKNSTVTGGPGRNSPMAMAAMTEKPKHMKKTIKRILKYFKSYIPYLIIVCIIASMSTVFSVLAPKVMSGIINSIEKTVIARINDNIIPINYTFIGKFLFVLLFFYVSSAVLVIVEQYIMSSVSQNVVRDMRKQVQRKLMCLPLSYFDNVSHGEILSRAVGDVENIAVSLQENVVQLVTGVVTLIGVFIMMLIISRILTLVVVITIPLYLFVAKPIIKRAQKLFKKRQKANGRLNGLIEEMYSGIKTVKAYGNENETKCRFDNINNDYCNAGWKAQFITGTIMPLTTFLTNFSYVLICIVSGLLFANGYINLGDVLAFLFYVKLFSRPVNQITSISNSIQSSIVSAERVFEILDENEEIENENENIIFKDGSVEFKDICFSYTKEKELIKNLSLNVNEGESIAIVGHTGAGKTTLVNLLMRFYDINSGKILVGGIDISTCKRNKVRDQFGMVLQDTWLFNGTIMDNIRYGKDNATNLECIEAAKKAQAHHFITTLPDGYNTILNEESSNISQGEKQLITIARTLLHNPKILILDEATSNVDTLTEQRLQDGMNEIMKNRTCFIIAHRLSTIKNANKILVMDNGVIVEIGTHDSLLKQDGIYAELYKSQFA